VSFEQVADAARDAMAAADVPGVSLGHLGGGEAQYAAFGVTSLENPLPVTPGTLFQIGSITKTFTGTLAMQLVGEGLLDLDAPVRTYLPGLRLGDEAAAAGATMRHLLTHMGGWEGDYFDDPSRGDDALALIVERLAGLPQVVPLGAIFSYNNAGFYIAGRVLELVGGEPYERLVEERILRPLGLDDTYFFPEDVMTQRFAAGHHEADGDEGTVVEVARPWQLPRAANAAGGLTSTVGDLLRWARFHLGAEPAWLPSMRDQQATIRPGEHVGLTWLLHDVGDLQLFGHDGGTNGQISRLLIAPDEGEAVVVLTNATRGSEVTAAVMRAFLRRLGVEQPEPVALDLPRAALAEYAGKYVSRLVDIEVVLSDAGLSLHYASKGGFPLPDSPPLPMPPPVPVAIAATDIAFVPDGPFRGERVEFLRDGDAIAWLREGARLYRREPA
jgi:CubicO group peptidase (beta-lactamase class C family)